MLRELGLQPAVLPTNDDPTADALGPAGQSRRIARDLDIIRTYAGWAQLDSAVFGAGGFFDCQDHEVFCGLDPEDLGGHDVVLAAVQTNGHIGFGERRGAEMTVAFDRAGHENAPPDFTAAGYAGADLVVIVHLDVENMIAIEFDGQDYASVHVSGRVRIVGDTAFFVVAAVRDEQPVVRFVTQADRWYCQTRPSGEVECAEPDPWSRGQLDYAPMDTFIELDDSL